MARRRFRGSTRKGSRLPVRWTGDLLLAEDTVAAAATDANAIVVPADYEQSTTMEQSGVTLLRIRGTVLLRATVTGALAYMAIFAVHENAPINNPNTLAGFIDSNCLWRSVTMVPTDTVHRLELDVKAQRRLQDDQLVFAISAVAQTVTYSFGLRCLLRGG